MSRKPTLTCTTPHGVFTRGTWRKYSHVLVAVHQDGTGTAISWHGSLVLAQGALNYWATEIGKHVEITGQIFPVDGGPHDSV